jgi:hypothetical protein
MQIRTASEIEAERKAFKADRVGHNGNIRARMQPRRITYLAHGKGWVMARHPGCSPFAIQEQLWRSFPLYERPPHSQETVK